ncbi:hypothetical protein BDQ17DRAFT_1431631 [Cyathus striatus]|nr:hypothetical protein BDQ17DRAFT_1431631 [Cyathus striatus]
MDNTAPVDFNVADLAKCTHQAISVLYPWCTIADSDCRTAFPGTVEVAREAERYILAVELSMQAAEHGFAVAQEAIDLNEMMASVSENEKLEYIRGTLRLAQKGRLKAKETLSVFTNVEMNISSLIKKLPAEMFNFSENSEHGDLNSIQTIEAWIKPLSEFKSAVTAFEAWWLSIFLQNVANEHKTELLIELYNRLREESLVNNWKKLQMQHADYVKEIDFCLSRHPKFLDLLNSIKKKDNNKADSCPEYEDHNYVQLLNRSLYYGVSINAVFESINIYQDSTQFVVEFQCDSFHKIKRLKITCDFTPDKGGNSQGDLHIIDIAPKQCVGYVTEERQYVDQRLEVPIGFSFLGLNAGITAGVEKKVSKKVQHGMSIVGYNGGKKCSWTLKENGNVASGIPPHFQLRFNLFHQGPFGLSITVEAKIKLYKYLPSLRSKVREDKEIDTLKLQKFLVASSGRRSVDDNFNGEVPNAYRSFNSPPMLN